MSENEVIKQNINFLEYPLWVPGDRNKEKVYEMQDIDGYKYVSIGAPSKVDMMILYYVLLYCQNQGYKRKIKLSMFEILKGCGVNPSRKERLKESLNKWLSVNISFTGTFYDKKGYSSLNFHIIDTWSIEENTPNQVEIIFNEEWLKKIKDTNFFKYISFAEMKHLRSPVAMRLYEILSKSFYQKDIFEISAEKLQIKLQITQKYYSEVKRVVAPAVKTINQKTNLHIKLETRATKRNEGVFIFIKVKKSMLDLMKEELETDKRHSNKMYDEEKILENYTPEELERLKNEYIANELIKNKFILKTYNSKGWNKTIEMDFISYLSKKKSV